MSRKMFRNDEKQKEVMYLFKTHVLENWMESVCY